MTLTEVVRFGPFNENFVLKCMGPAHMFKSWWSSKLEWLEAHQMWRCLLFCLLNKFLHNHDVVHLEIAERQTSFLADVIVLVKAICCCKMIQALESGSHVQAVALPTDLNYYRRSCVTSVVKFELVAISSFIWYTVSNVFRLSFEFFLGHFGITIWRKLSCFVISVLGPSTADPIKSDVGLL